MFNIKNAIITTSISLIFFGGVYELKESIDNKEKINEMEYSNYKNIKSELNFLEDEVRLEENKYYYVIDFNLKENFFELYNYGTNDELFVGVYDENNELIKYEEVIGYTLNSLSYIQIPKEVYINNKPKKIVVELKSYVDDIMYVKELSL